MTENNIRLNQAMALVADYLLKGIVADVASPEQNMSAGHQPAKIETLQSTKDQHIEIHQMMSDEQSQLPA